MWGNENGGEFARYRPDGTDCTKSLHLIYDEGERLVMFQPRHY